MATFIASATGGKGIAPAPPPEEHEAETPNPMNSAVLHTLGFGLLALTIELAEAGDTMEEMGRTNSNRMGVLNPNAIRPEAMMKPPGPRSGFR